MPLNYSPIPVEMPSPLMWPPVVICSAPSTPPILVQYAPVFSAGAVLLVGIVAATIAYRQWRTAHTKVQLDLYAQRLPTWKAVRNFLTSCASGGASRDELEALRATRDEAAFIFSERVADFIGELYTSGWDADRRGETWYDHDTDIVHEADPENAIEHWEAIATRRAEAFDLFAPFLRLEDRNNVAFRDLWQKLSKIAERALDIAATNLIR